MNWTAIRTLGNLKYFGMSYGVLIGVPLLADLFAIAAEINAIPGRPLSLPPTLKWLYFASLAFAAGFTIYQLFCPQEQKRFATPDEYLENAFERYERAHPQHRVNIVLARLDPNVDAGLIERIKQLTKEIGKSEIGDREQKQTELDDYVDSLHSDAVQKYLLLEFEELDKSRPIPRWLVTISFAVGGFVLLILFLTRSYSVFYFA
jgi:hypothetical protein